MFNFKQITGTLKAKGKVNNYQNDLKRYSNQIELPETGMVIDVVAWNEQADRLAANFNQGDQVTLYGVESIKTTTNKFSETYEFHEFKVKGTNLPRKSEHVEQWSDEEIHQRFLTANGLTAQEFENIKFDPEYKKFQDRMLGVAC